MPRDVVRTYEFTRPANATAYADGDVVNATTAIAMTLQTTVRTKGGGGKITKARLVKSDVGVSSAQFRLYIFVGQSPPTPIDDNSPYTMLYSNRQARIGFVDFTMETEGSGSDSAEDIVLPDLPFIVDPSNTDLHLILTTQAAWTPTSSEKFYMELTIEPR